jgi:gamma-polyglutamate synthase
VKSIRIRVNINGVRGNSTVSRFFTAILKEANLRTIGKTTGTSARMIYWYTDEEEPIVRGKTGANIGEQKGVVKKAADLNAEALVSECMAVNPDYQIIFQEQMLQANVGVIVNVLEDHMDVMGPTLDDVAETFTHSIPYRGYLIITEGPYAQYYKQIARARRTKVVVANPSKVPEGFIKQFDYMVFPEHVALTLAVAEALGIAKQAALEGMLKRGQPDPFVTRIYHLFDKNNPSFFVSGFAINDAQSTLTVWDNIKKIGYDSDEPVIVMNCREDRVDRTEHFAKNVLPKINMDTLILIGTVTKPVVNAFEAGHIPAKRILNMEKRSTTEILNALQNLGGGRVIYGIGNLHGAGLPLVEAVEKEALPGDKSSPDSHGEPPRGGSKAGGAHSEKDEESVAGSKLQKRPEERHLVHGTSYRQ